MRKTDEFEKKSESAIKADNTERLIQQRFDEYEKQINDLSKQMAVLKDHVMKPFERIGSKYYYIENNDELSWFQAGDKCTQLGGHLSSLQNENELKAISQKLTKGRYWLDINDLEQEGVFKSLTSGQNQAYLNWYYAGEPNNGNNEYGNNVFGEEDCIELFELGGVYGMNDNECSFGIGFICEKEF